MNNNELQTHKNYLNHQEYLKTRLQPAPQANLSTARIYNFQYGPDQNFQPVLQQNQLGFQAKVPNALSQSAVNNTIANANNRLSMMRQYSQQQLPTQQQILLQRSVNQDMNKQTLLNNFQAAAKSQVELRSQYNNSVGGMGALTASMNSRQSIIQDQESPSTRFIGLQRESQGYQSATSLLKYQQLSPPVSSFMPQQQNQTQSITGVQQQQQIQQALNQVNKAFASQKTDKDQQQPQNLLDNPKYLQMIIQQQQQQIDLMKALLQMQLQNQQLNMTNFVQLQNQLNQATNSQSQTNASLMHQSYSPSRTENPQPLNSPVLQQKIQNQNNKSHHSSPLKISRPQNNESHQKVIQPFNQNSSTISRLDNLDVLSNYKSPSSIEQQVEEQFEGQVIVQNYKEDKIDEVRSIDVLSNTLSFNSTFKPQSQKDKQKVEINQEMPRQSIVNTVKSHDSNYSRNGREHNESYLKNFEIQTQSRPLSQLENLEQIATQQLKTNTNPQSSRLIESNNSQSKSHSSRRSHKHQKSLQTSKELNIFHPDFDTTPLQTFNNETESKERIEDTANMIIQQQIVVQNTPNADQIVEVQSIGGGGLVLERKFNQLETIDSVDQESSKFDTRNISPENTKRTSINFDFALELRQNENLISVKRNSSQPQKLEKEKTCNLDMVIHDDYLQVIDDKKCKRQSKLGADISLVEKSQNSGDKRRSQISQNSKSTSILQSYQTELSKDKSAERRSPSANRFKKSEHLKHWINQKQKDNEKPHGQINNQRAQEQEGKTKLQVQQKQVLQRINNNHKMPKPMFQSHYERQPKTKQINGSVKSAFSPKSSVASSQVNQTNPTQTSILTKQSTTQLSSDLSKSSPSQNNCVDNRQQKNSTQHQTEKQINDKGSLFTETHSFQLRKQLNMKIVASQKNLPVSLFSPDNKRQSISRNAANLKSMQETKDKTRNLETQGSSNHKEDKIHKSLLKNLELQRIAHAKVGTGIQDQRRSLSRQRNKNLSCYNTVQEINAQMKSIKTQIQSKQLSSSRISKSPVKITQIQKQNNSPNQVKLTVNTSELTEQNKQNTLKQNSAKKSLSPLKLQIKEKQMQILKESTHSTEPNAFKRKKSSKEISQDIQTQGCQEIQNPPLLNDSSKPNLELQKVSNNTDESLSHHHHHHQLSERNDTLEFVQLENLVNQKQVVDIMNEDVVRIENDMQKINYDQHNLDKTLNPNLLKENSQDKALVSRRNTEERNLQIQKLEIELEKLKEKTRQYEQQAKQLEDQLCALKSINSHALQKNCLDSLNSWKEQQQVEIASMKQSFQEKILELERLRRESLDEVEVQEGPILHQNRQSQSHSNIQSYFTKIHPGTQDLSKKIERRFQMHHVDSSYSIFNNSTPQNEQSEQEIKDSAAKLMLSPKYDISSIQTVSTPTASIAASQPGSAQNACSPTTVQNKQKRVSFKDQELERRSIEKLAVEEFEKNLQIQEIQKELKHLIKDLNKISQEEQIYFEKLYGDTNAQETDESRSNMDRISQSPKLKQKSQSLQSSPEHIPVVKGNYDLTPENVEEYPEGLNYDELYRDYGMIFPSEYTQSQDSEAHNQNLT